MAAYKPPSWYETMAWYPAGPVVYVGDHMQLWQTILSQQTNHFYGRLGLSKKKITCSYRLMVILGWTRDVAQLFGLRILRASDRGKSSRRYLPNYDDHMLMFVCLRSRHVQYLETERYHRSSAPYGDTLAICLDPVTDTREDDRSATMIESLLYAPVGDITMLLRRRYLKEDGHHNHLKQPLGPSSCTMLTLPPRPRGCRCGFCTQSRPKGTRLIRQLHPSKGYPRSARCQRPLRTGANHTGTGNDPSVVSHQRDPDPDHVKVQNREESRETCAAGVATEGEVCILVRKQMLGGQTNALGQIQDHWPELHRFLCAQDYHQAELKDLYESISTTQQ